jgi:hypothetical protein
LGPKIGHPINPISLFAQFPSLVTWVLGATLMNIAATGDHDHQQSIQQYPTAPKCQTERVFQFFQHVFILLISIATLCNSFHMDPAVL